jgi:hypothetical protein
LAIDRIMVDYEVLGLVAIKALLDRIADPLQTEITISVPCSASVG